MSGEVDGLSWHALVRAGALFAGFCVSVALLFLLRPLLGELGVEKGGGRVGGREGGREGWREGGMERESSVVWVVVERGPCPAERGGPCLWVFAQ